MVEYVHGDDVKPPDMRTPITGHPTGNRFRSLFGQNINWQTTGFKGWLEEQRGNNGFPFD